MYDDCSCDSMLKWSTTGGVVTVVHCAYVCSSIDNDWTHAVMPLPCVLHIARQTSSELAWGLVHDLITSASRLVES